MGLVNKNLNNANPFFAASNLIGPKAGEFDSDLFGIFHGWQQDTTQQNNQGQRQDQCNQQNQQCQYQWLISADKIFSSEWEGFEEYARFFDLDFHIYKFSMSTDGKASDTSICAENIKVCIPNGSHCAVIQSHLAQGKEISKIILKKVSFMLDKTVTMEEKEFSKCFVQTFSRKGEKAIFSFRYSSYKDTYTDFKADGTKKGTAGVSVDLIKWEIK
ncbi:MAG: hypothetical protein LBT90_00145 [Holosporaceae bacterium]|jgi:hypothetical protein|nr:hypothetical protein [Holosporaceae bacterium]